MQDEDIVALYWKREEAAIRETEQKYGHYLMKIAYNILADVEDSQESVNDISESMGLHAAALAGRAVHLSGENHTATIH